MEGGLCALLLAAALASPAPGTGGCGRPTDAHPVSRSTHDRSAHAGRRNRGIALGAGARPRAALRGAARREHPASGAYRNARRLRRRQPIRRLPVPRRRPVGDPRAIHRSRLPVQRRLRRRRARHVQRRAARIRVLRQPARRAGRHAHGRRVGERGLELERDLGIRRAHHGRGLRGGVPDPAHPAPLRDDRGRPDVGDRRHPELSAHRPPSHHAVSAGSRREHLPWTGRKDLRASPASGACRTWRSSPR